MSAMPNLPQPEWDAAYLDAEGEMMEMPACWGCAFPRTPQLSCSHLKAPALMHLAPPGPPEHPSR